VHAAVENSAEAITLRTGDILIPRIASGEPCRPNVSTLLTVLGMTPRRAVMG
jgi:hypothetical protein